MKKNPPGSVHIGSPDGLIAVWLDEREARAMAFTYGAVDTFHDELLRAVEIAYPPPAPPSPGEEV